MRPLEAADRAGVIAGRGVDEPERQLHGGEPFVELERAPAARPRLLEEALVLGELVLTQEGLRLAGVRERVGGISRQRLVEHGQRAVEVLGPVVPLQVAPPLQVELVGAGRERRGIREGASPRLGTELELEHLGHPLDQGPLQGAGLRPGRLDVPRGEHEQRPRVHQVRDHPDPVPAPSGRSRATASVAPKAARASFALATFSFSTSLGETTRSERPELLELAQPVRDELDQPGRERLVRAASPDVRNGSTATIFSAGSPRRGRDPARQPLRAAAGERATTAAAASAATTREPPARAREPRGRRRARRRPRDALRPLGAPRSSRPSAASAATTSPPSRGRATGSALEHPARPAPPSAGASGTRERGRPRPLRGPGPAPGTAGLAASIR